MKALGIPFYTSPDISAKIKELEQMNKRELQQIAATINDELGTEPGDMGYIPATAMNKDELVSRLAEQAMHGEVNQPFAGIKQRTVRVRLDQIESDPLNFRHDVDYYDKTLQQSIINAGGLLKAPFVTPSGSTTDDGREKFYIVGGNRSTHSLREVLRSKGENPDAYEIEVMVREYDGKARDRHVQKIMEMVMDNESQQAMSPIDLMHAYQELERSGMARTDIADKFSKSGAHVSQILKFAMLPERVQDLMHFESNRDRLAAQKDEEFYRANNIPFTKVNGEYQVHGVGYKQAMHMCSIFKRRPAKTAKKSERAEWDQHVLDVQDFLLREEILNAAQEMSGPEFEQFLNRRAQEVGILEREEAVQKLDEVQAASKAPVRKPKADTTSALEPGLEDASVDVAASDEEFEKGAEAFVQLGQVEDDFAPVEKPKVTDAPTVSRVVSSGVSANLSSGSYAEMLAKGRLELTVDWAEILSDRLKVGDNFAERVVKWMVLNEMLREV
jgi:hypothetical protein